MKKFLVVLVMAVVFMVGCGSKAEPVTEAEVLGYWYTEETPETVLQITEGGMLIACAPMKWGLEGQESVSLFSLPMGVIMYLEDEVTITMNGALSEDDKSETISVTFSEDRNTMYFEKDGETSEMKRISEEEMKELLGITEE